MHVHGWKKKFKLFLNGLCMEGQIKFHNLDQILLLRCGFVRIIHDSVLYTIFSSCQYSNDYCIFILSAKAIFSFHIYAMLMSQGMISFFFNKKFRWNQRWLYLLMLVLMILFLSVWSMLQVYGQECIPWDILMGKRMNGLV